MATTKISANVLASGAALTNINAGSTIDFTKNVSMSGNLTVDTNTLVVDSVNNYVGIGTITPTAPLEIVNNTSNAIAKFTHSNSQAIFLNRTASVYNGFGFQDSGTEKWFIGQKSSSNNLVFCNNGNADTISMEFPSPNNTIYITSVGNVGIGTTSPSEKLTVVGNISASGTVTGTNLVYNTGDQTIAGAKTFSNDTVINGGLTINSTTKGVYLPRMTTTQRDALSPVAEGLTIYDTSKSNLQTYNSTLATWQNAVNSSSVRSMVSLTRSEYDSLSSKDSETVYIITDDVITNPIVYPLYSTSVDYTITTSDAVILVTANSPIITLPTATDKIGRVYYVKNRSSLSCSLSTTASELIDGLSAISIPTNNSVQTISIGSGWIIL